VRQKGLAYHVSAALDPLYDTSLLEIDSACLPEKLPQLVSEIAALLSDLRTTLVSEEELAKAKGRYARDVEAGFDDLEGLCSWFGGTALFFSRPRSPAERYRRVAAVSASRFVRWPVACCSPSEWWPWWWEAWSAACRDGWNEFCGIRFARLLLAGLRRFLLGCAWRACLDADDQLLLDGAAEGLLADDEAGLGLHFAMALLAGDQGHIEASVAVGAGRQVRPLQARFLDGDFLTGGQFKVSGASALRCQPGLVAMFTLETAFSPKVVLTGLDLTSKASSAARAALLARTREAAQAARRRVVTFANGVMQGNMIKSSLLTRSRLGKPDSPVAAKWATLWPWRLSSKRRNARVSLRGPSPPTWRCTTRPSWPRAFKATRSST